MSEQDTVKITIEMPSTAAGFTITVHNANAPADVVPIGTSLILNNGATHVDVLDRMCPECGVDFTATHHNQRYCGIPCRNARNARREKEFNAEIK